MSVFFIHLFVEKDVIFISLTNSMHGLYLFSGQSSCAHGRVCTAMVYINVASLIFSRPCSVSVNYMYVTSAGDWCLGYITVTDGVW